MKSAAVAWVESPLQLINAIEYTHASGHEMDIALRPGTSQLTTTVEALRSQLPAHARVVEASAPAWNGVFSSAAHKVVGDMLSGQVRAALAIRSTTHATIIDDGATTLALAQQLDSRAGLTRPGATDGPVARGLGRMAARKLRLIAGSGRASLFTAYGAWPQVKRLESVGMELQSNHYEWLRGLALTLPFAPESTVVLGSALPADGAVDAELYFNWVQSLATDPLTYFPHRREDPTMLDRIERQTDAQVVHTGLPIEVVLATVRHVGTIVTLPSSVIASLPCIVASDTRLRLQLIPDSWWTHKCADGVRELAGNLVQGANSRWTT